MAKTSIELPHDFAFAANIPIRITDLNYGGHVGNDTILSLIHEARVQFLSSYGYTEKDLGGTGIIMSDVSIIFKSELFYRENVKASVAVGNITRASFDLFYKLETADRIVAHAKTGMVCFDYEKRKIAAIPQIVIQRWS